VAVFHSRDNIYQETAGNEATDIIEVEGTVLPDSESGGEQQSASDEKPREAEASVMATTSRSGPSTGSTGIRIAGGLLALPDMHGARHGEYRCEEGRGSLIWGIVE